MPLSKDWYLLQCTVCCNAFLGHDGKDLCDFCEHLYPLRDGSIDVESISCNVVDS